MAARKNFPLRMSVDIYAAIERWAADDFRSVNGQIEYILRQALIRNGRLGKETAGTAEMTDSGEKTDDG